MKNYNSMFLVLALIGLIGISFQAVSAEMDESTMEEKKDVMNEMEQAMEKEREDMMKNKEMMNMMNEMEDTKTKGMDSMMKDHKVSPKKQFASGVDIHEIKCKEGYELALKTTDWSPACCKSSSVDKLIERGWAADHDTKHNKMMDSMINKMESSMMEDMESLMEAKEMMKEAENNPTTVSEDMSEMMDDASSEMQVIKTGEFEGLFFHHAEGLAKIVRTDDKTFLRFENFEVTNGPDLRVYLTSGGDVKNGVHLDKLKGSKGDQNYVLENIDIENYDTVVIYCQPFGVYFGQAELS